MSEALIYRSSSSIRRTFRIGSSRRSGSSSLRKIYGPKTLGLKDDQLQADGAEDEKGAICSELLAKIQSCYQRVEHKEVFDNGFCFGLLDPVSNIVIGVFIARAVEVDFGDEAPFARLGAPDLFRDMSKRSLNGLIAFLAALFPSLSEAKAIWYLKKSWLDPLVAARLIIKHRGMERSFGLTSDTTVAAVETALRCAAAAAQHPNPLKFVSGWKSVSPFLNQIANLLSGTDATFDENRFSHMESHMQSILRQDTQPSVVFSLEKSWDLACSRLVKLCPDPFSENKVQVYPERSTMRRMLLTTIHGYYLQALARLPKDKLRSQYHHSMLQAGHCYGPFDPVSNIILNTIWYSAAFPLTKDVPIKAISTKGLLRIAVRSFYGLVSFMCTRWTLNADEAMQLLQVDGAGHGFASRNLLLDCGMNGDVMVSGSVEEAYTAVAIAGRHPVPRLQATLLGPSNPLLRMVSDYLLPGGMLSHEVTDALQTALVYSCEKTQPEQEQEQQRRETIVLHKWAYATVDKMRIDFWSQHDRVVKMVISAIDQMVSKYELHVICGVNECVDLAHSTGTYNRSHVNFLATRSAGGPPTLFFAEFHGTEVGLCCPVKVPPPGTEQVRCLYCEFHGSRIVHPASKGFSGRNTEFEKMLSGDGLFSESYDNDDIINHSHEVTYWVDDVEDDCIYRSYSHADDKDEGVDEYFFNERRYAEIN